jgi:hypothetical protein
MRRTIALTIAATLATVAVPAAAYYWTRPGEDPLGDTLRGWGFLPVNPPSNLMNVGSLYYVDTAAREFKAICHASKTEVESAITVSRSWDMQEDLERKGRFATGVHVDLRSSFNADLDSNYVHRVHASLTDVFVEELPLGANSLILAKMMEKPECNRVAMRYISAGNYVCQGQKLLQATAEYQLGVDSQNKLATKAKVTPDEVKNVVKLAIEAHSGESVVERAGRLLAGSALKYGVSMNPTCLAPLTARFERVLPRTAFGRAVNFVLFSIVEPLFPANPDRVEVAAR